MITGYLWGLYWDNGKEHGNYYVIWFNRFNVGDILG